MPAYMPARLEAVPAVQKVQSAPGAFTASLVTVAVTTSTSIFHVAAGFQTPIAVHIGRPA
jgi:hypothetical protein